MTINKKYGNFNNVFDPSDLKIKPIMQRIKLPGKGALKLKEQANPDFNLKVKPFRQKSQRLVDGSARKLGDFPVSKTRNDLIKSIKETEREYDVDEDESQTMDAKFGNFELYKELD